MNGHEAAEFSVGSCELVDRLTFFSRPNSEQRLEAIGMAVEGISSATFLTDEQKRDIFYNNAVTFFRLRKP
jgi:hypothetical protein